MSQQENPFDSKRLPIVFIIAGIIILGGFSGAIGVGGGGASDCTLSIGTLRNNTCPAIIFDGIASNTIVTTCPCNITATITATAGDLLVVFASSENQGNAASSNITSVIDTQSDTFTLAVHTYVKATSFCCSSDFWTGRMSASSTTVTVSWGTNPNPTANGLTLFVATYRNVAGVGTVGSQCASTSASGVPPCITADEAGNFTMILKKTGSVVVGGTALESSFSTPACSKNYIVAGQNLTQRSQLCLIATDNMQADFEDNMGASYSNGFPFFYSTTWITPDPPLGDIQDSTTQAIELLPSQFNGINVGFNDVDNFCPTTGDSCHVNGVGKSTGANAINQVLTLGTVYCTGITTPALTISSASTILLWGDYGGNSLNVTGAKLLVALKIGTSPPSTSFGSGTCATSTSLTGTASLYFPISGALSTTNTFSVAVNGFCSAVTCMAGTYYAWLDITPQNFAGHLNYDQLCTSVTFAICSIGMAQIK